MAAIFYRGWPPPATAEGRVCGSMTSCCGWALQLLGSLRGAVAWCGAHPWQFAKSWGRGWISAGFDTLIPSASFSFSRGLC